MVSKVLMNPKSKGMNIHTRLSDLLTLLTNTGLDKIVLTWKVAKIPEFPLEKLSGISDSMKTEVILCRKI